MRRGALTVGILWFSMLVHASSGVSSPQHPVKGRDKKLASSYVLPYLREIGKVDPLWGTEIPLVDDRRSQRPPREHMAELRTWAKTHPGDRERIAWYLRIFRKLDPYVKQREQRALAEQSHPPDELALEYRLPHLGAADHPLPAGLADPLHGYTKNGVVYYVNGDVMTKKAPHVHIAELAAWSVRHPAGKPLAERYIAFFQRRGEEIYAADRELRAKASLHLEQLTDLHVENSVLLRRHLRLGLPVPKAESDHPEWDAHSHDPTWVRAHLPSERHLDKGKVSNPFMRAFRKLVARSKAADEKPLAGFRIIGLQHLLSNTGSFIRALADAGVAPHDSVYMGKTYSQHPETMDELRAEGFGIREARYEPTPERGFGNSTDNRRRELDDMVREMVRVQHPPGYVSDPLHPQRFVDTKHKYLVVDDGGDLIEHIHLHYPSCTIASWPWSRRARASARCAGSACASR